MVIAQPFPYVAQTVNLALCSLPTLPFDMRVVVPENRTGPGRDGARSALAIHAHEGKVVKPEEQPLPEGAAAVGAPADFKAGLRVLRRSDRPMPSVASS